MGSRETDLKNWEGVVACGGRDGLEAGTGSLLEVMDRFHVLTVGMHMTVEIHPVLDIK